MSVKILCGDATAMLKTLPSESVQCVVTSPPYLGLRSYGTDPVVWGGDPEHAHAWGTGPSPGSRTSDTKPGPLQHAGNMGRERLTSDLCACGAWRGELGLEPTPALFVAHLVEIFEEVKRVMRPDAVLFVNLGDSYWTRSAMRAGGNREQIKAMAGEITMPSWKEHAAQGRTRYSSGHPTLKDKDLTLIPERFAIAMQEAGWIVRSEIVWAKKSCMPESVRDRPTSAWEPIWMFAKSPRYYFDQDAVRQPLMGERHAPGNKPRQGITAQERWKQGVPTAPEADPDRVWGNAGGANLRNFWLLSPEPSREQHYAAFPTELPRRCIKAATSEKGACPACGAPWVRVTEKGESTRQGPTASGWRERGGDHAAVARVGERPYETLGWQPSCQCPTADPVPCVVLDPFMGTGTTALVADQLGRHAIGIELNPKYAEMARARIENDAPMVSEPVTVASPQQATLFEAAG